MYICNRVGLIDGFMTAIDYFWGYGLCLSFLVVGGSRRPRLTGIMGLMGYAWDKKAEGATSSTWPDM